MAKIGFLGALNAMLAIVFTYLNTVTSNWGNGVHFLVLVL